LTEIEAEEMDVGLGRFFDGSYRIEERTMLEVTQSRKGRTLIQEIGLNEVVVDHSGETNILRLEIDVGGQRVGVIDADGAIVATASGSTAYAQASGGPILEPTLEDLVLVPMNPFALTVRPIVFAPGQEISLTVVRGAGGRCSSTGLVARPARGPPPTRFATARSEPRLKQSSIR